MKQAIRVVALLLLLALAVSGCTAVPAPAAQETAESGEAVQLSVIHYFSDTLGKEAMSKILSGFNAAHPGTEALDNSAGHEDFKTQILVTLAGNNPPELFSYGAGARSSSSTAGVWHRSTICGPPITWTRSSQPESQRALPPTAKASISSRSATTMSACSTTQR